MATANVSEFLAVNTPGTAPFDTLALKVYSGMILEAFNKTTTTEGRIMTRTITSGKSAQFPVIGRTTTLTHVRGTEVASQALDIHSNERVIEVDDILMSPVFIDVLDEAKTHYDVRRPYATQQGQALAEENDKRALMALVGGSYAAANFTTGDAGQRYAVASTSTTVATLKGSIYDAAESMDDHSVPSTERTLWLKPAQYYMLLSDGEFIDRDFNDGSNGSRAKAILRNASDFEVVKTTNMPNASEIGNTALPASQRRDFTKTVAVAAHSSAAGCVSLMGIMFESEYQMNRQGWLLVAKQARGYDYLRPEATVEIADV